MPWTVSEDTRCPSGKPWAVVKQADGSVVACHATKESAIAQQKALYAKEPTMSKSLLPVKAQLMDDAEERAWFEGRTPRRLLAIPFGGPIPSPKTKLGVDLDDQWFDETTDIYGPYFGLRKSRERLVDFMHSYQPPGPQYGDRMRNPTTGEAGLMMGHLLGKSILDPDPEEDGWWVDLWFEAGNRRVAMVDALAKRGARLFGSSQPLGKAMIEPSGHIGVWPYWLQTITTTPQNTYSVIRPKALNDFESVLRTDNWSAIEEALRSLAPSLKAPHRAELEAKAGRVLSAANWDDTQAALDALQAGLDRLRRVVDRQPDYAKKDEVSTT